MRIFWLSLLTFAACGAMAEEGRNPNLIAIGQGISSPSSTSTVNFSSAYTHESPLGVLYQNGFRVSLQYDRNVNTATGLEAGYGSADWGAAIGYRNTSCGDCEVTPALSLAYNVTVDVGIGIRYAQNLYAGAVIVNPRGENRFAFMAEFDDTSKNNQTVSGFGAGYSYVTAAYTLTLDASVRDQQNNTASDDQILITPGIMVRADIFQLSVNDKISLKKDGANGVAKDDKYHTLWFGIGVGGESWHSALYSNYVNDLALVGSWFF